MRKPLHLTHRPDRQNRWPQNHILHQCQLLLHRHLRPYMIRGQLKHLPTQLPPAGHYFPPDQFTPLRQEHLIPPRKYRLRMRHTRMRQPAKTSPRPQPHLHRLRCPILHLKKTLIRLRIQFQSSILLDLHPDSRAVSLSSTPGEEHISMRCKGPVLSSVIFATLKGGVK